METQASHEHNTLPQESDDSCMSVTKLPSIGKDVPKLNAENARLWRFQLEINTRACNPDLGKYIFDSPQKQANEDVTTAETKSEELQQFEEFQKQFRDKADGSGKQLLGHAFAEIVRTLEDHDKMNIMMIKYDQPDVLFHYLIGEYNINTRRSRSEKIKSLFNAEWERNEPFSSFINKIDMDSAEINHMSGAEVTISDSLKLAVLLTGVVANHEDEFRVIVEMIEQQPNITYKRAIEQMKPVARRMELQNAKQAKQARQFTGHEQARPVERKNNKSPLQCWDFRDYGECNRTNCNFSHTGEPGTKRCGVCRGKHNQKNCPKKKNESAAVAKNEQPLNSNNKPAATKEKPSSANVGTAKVASVLDHCPSETENYYSDYDDDANDARHKAKANVAKEPSSSPPEVIGLTPPTTNVKRTPSTPPTKPWKFGYYPTLAIMLIVIPLLYALTEEHVPVFSLVAGGLFQDNDQHHKKTILTLLVALMASVFIRPASAGIATQGVQWHHMGYGVASNISDVCMLAGAANRSTLNHSHANNGTFRSWWSIDSACTVHITNNLNIIDKKTRRTKTTKIETANGKFMYSRVTGNATLKVKDSKGTVSKLYLEQVLYVPESSSNLISVGQLLSKHHRLVFDEGKCEITNKISKVRNIVNMRSNMFDIQQLSDTELSMVADSHGQLSELELWHNRLCHYSDQYVSIATGLKLDHKIDWCEACIEGGIHRRPFHKTERIGHKCRFKGHRSNEPKIDDEEMKTQERLDLVMADTCQPFTKTASTGYNKYFFLFVDVHTRKKWIRFGKNKSDLTHEFKTWATQIENETGRFPVKFMPDGGKEFDNNNMETFLKEKGILFEITCTDCPNQNAYVERANGLVLTHMHKMLAHSGLPDKYWEDAARLSVEVQNAMPVKSMNWATPNSMWDNRRDVTLQRVRTFGCEAWYVVPKAHRRKGEAKARKGVYLGTSEKHKGWKILDLETRKVINSRDVYFHENKFPFKDPKESRSPLQVAKDNDDFVYLKTGDDNYTETQSEPLELQEAPEASNEHDHDSVPSDDGMDHKHNGDEEAPAVFEPKRSERAPPPVNYRAGMNLKTKMRNLNGRSVNVGYTGLGGRADSVINPQAEPSSSPNLLAAGPMSDPLEIDLSNRDNSDHEVITSEEDEIASQAIGLAEDFKTMTRRQIMRGPYKREFLEAEKRELDCLKLHGTYRVCERPMKRTPVTCRWCYDVKRDADNKIILFKARLVARGFEQVEGVDYNETFAACAQMKSFRTTLALCQLLGLRMTQIDISSAFLHGELDEEIYMSWPPGYIPEGYEGKCLQLRKGIYGLKQAGRIWNRKFVQTLQDIGFEQLTSDSQVLQLRRGKSVLIIGLHVDDATLSSNDEKLRKEVITKLEKHFLVKDLGPISHYLGLRVKAEDPGVKEIVQDGYIHKMIAKFRLENAQESETPGVAGQILSKVDCPTAASDEQNEMKRIPFRQIVGSLMYSYIGSRPDIGATLVKVASFCNNPGKLHWQAAKRILKYLKGTINQGIRYTGKLYKGHKVKITAYCDSDWAQDPDDRKSTTGYVVMIAGGPVSWQCKKQPTHALSATEAEFVALTECTKDILWLTYFLTELGIEYDTPMIYCDSQSANEWTKNASHHQRNKHVALKYFFIRDEVARNTIKIAYVSTKDNVADILTKSTTRSIFKYLQPKLMGYAYRAVKVLGKGVRRITRR